MSEAGPSARAAAVWTLASTCAGWLLGRAVNSYLALDPRSRARLARLDQRALGIAVEGLGLRLTLSVAEGELRLGGATREVDAWVRGAPLALLSLALSDGVRALFSGRVRLQGDAEVAKRFKRLLDGLDIDWEEQLARHIGDYAARRAVRAAIAMAAWSARSRAALGEDLADFLHEERSWLAHPREARAFYDDVDTLRDDGARLAARVARLERREA